MNNEVERITKLFQEDKISKEEYTQLLETLPKKQQRNIFVSICSGNILQDLSPANSFVIGIIVVMILSFVASQSGVIFKGFLDFHTGQFENNHFAMVAVQILFSLVTATILFFVTGLLMKIKKIRLLDIFSSLSYTRIPYLIAIVLLLIISTINRTSVSEIIRTPYSLFIIIAALIWINVLTYNAFRVSVGKLHSVVYAVLLISIELTTVIGVEIFLPKEKSTISVTSLITKQDEIELTLLATQWNRLSDKKDYEGLIALSDTNFKEKVTPKSWQEASQKVIDQIGEIETRDLIKIEEVKTSPQYINVFFKSLSEKGIMVTERVVCIKDENGKWSVAGHFVE